MRCAQIVRLHNYKLIYTMCRARVRETTLGDTIKAAQNRGLKSFFLSAHQAAFVAPQVLERHHLTARLT